MSLREHVADRMFGHPRGVFGTIGGILMARTNADVAEWVLDLLEVRPDDRILEVGFGPGVGIRRAAQLSPDGFVAGVDASERMVAQARDRNARAIEVGRVELAHGSATDLPYDDETFDVVFSVNSMQVWPDTATGLRELHRVLKPGGTVALAFTPHAQQPTNELVDLVTGAEFEDVRLEEGESAVCTIAQRRA